ncbi:RagB/SusD family nutrient uptake outer membrane protein [Flammeovirga sp. MY04]|uniref:RagB/SusD family nutrient uptake outer membrane protein n=1 Tax=Flammeovirga sp. MY04 TaxID=1191459 RepID=UPI00082446F0|nr:RagB/SusD family nutrient uptake outer membrane protein [Flammeovirga sp. MY04]ANQ52470.2 RagB/SusD family nutrient uptake outer membrane protein [Flammeovirga sp. MY04]
MKKLLYTAGLALSVLFSTGCQNFLDMEPKSTWTPENYYTNEAKVEAAFAGLYSGLAGNNGIAENIGQKLEYGTDEGYYSQTWDALWPVSLYMHIPNSPEIEKSWLTLYTTINGTNLMIQNLDKDSFEEEKYNQLLGEAKFLRALCYTYLVTYWEDVPLRIKPTESQEENLLAASPQEDVYALIVEDFKFAAEYLPHSMDPEYIPGRANKMAAKGLLARVYMKMGGFPLQQTTYFDSALVQLDEIIYKDGWHQLRTSADTTGYELLFRDYIGGTYDLQESMFEMSFQNNIELGVPTMSAWGASNGLAFDNNASNLRIQRRVAVTPVMDLVYEFADRRHAWNIPRLSVNQNDKVVNVGNTFALQNTPGKFRRWTPRNLDDFNEGYEVITNEELIQRNNTPINIPILRYSDVLLMYAEASNEVYGGPNMQAIECLNQVRNRAGLENIEANDPTIIASKEAFFAELMDERLRELCYEGRRKFDLIRWGKLGERLQVLDQAMKEDPDYTNDEGALFWSVDGLSRPIKNFDPSKHLSLPYPLQEVNVNTALKQKPGW